ncbi:acetyltransferase, partial [Oleiphilus sp. HI0086]
MSEMSTGTKRTLLIIGAGGHGQAVMDLAEITGEYSDIFFADDNAPSDEPVMGKEVVAKVEDVFKGDIKVDDVFVAIGNNSVRKQIVERLKVEGFNLTSLIHPQATVSRYAQVEAGVAIMAGAYVGTSAVVRTGVVINANATADHDCVLHEFSHLGVGVQLAGGVEVGAMAWLQAGSC